MLNIACDTPECGYQKPISAQDYADGRFSLDCPDCGNGIWVEERAENTCLKCGAATRDPFCASCSVAYVVKVTPYGGRHNPIVESEFDYLTR